MEVSGLVLVINVTQGCAVWRLYRLGACPTLGQTAGRGEDRGIVEMRPGKASACWDMQNALRFTEMADRFMLRRYQQSLGNNATRALIKFLETKNPVTKVEAKRELKMCIDAQPH